MPITVVRFASDLQQSARRQVVQPHPHFVSQLQNIAPASDIKLLAIHIICAHTELILPRLNGFLTQLRLK
jgi:hypothetical protein